MSGFVIMMVIIVIYQLLGSFSAGYLEYKKNVEYNEVWNDGGVWSDILASDVSN